VPEHAIGSPATGRVEQDLGFRRLAGTPGDQVDHTSHGPRPVQSGRNALDDFDLPEIHRGDLQQADATRLAV
jgi:hypothetical protein